MIPWATASDTAASCVQVARGDVAWARCAGGDCVEAARTSNSVAKVLVRDSKEVKEHERGGPPARVQKWNRLEWENFIHKARLKQKHEAIRFDSNGWVLLGIETCPDRKEILHFTKVEWDAFIEGSILGTFAYSVLPDIGVLMQPSTCMCNKLSSPAEGFQGCEPSAGAQVEPFAGGSDQAATGADQHRRDTAPVAAQLIPLDDELDLLNSPAGREHRHG